jgi:exopolysaccharide production protein ExoY
MVLISIAIGLTAGWPLVYTQRRVGRYGRPFTIWKFRTMHPDGERILFAHLEHSSQARTEWHETRKLRQDPRITPVGKVLRQTSLDEIPQIFNVLVGQMSFVGPRPIVRKERCKYGERFAYYLAARPGITGLWQISGRSTLSYDARVILDEMYVRNWTLQADLRILLKTPQAILRRDGAC